LHNNIALNGFKNITVCPIAASDHYGSADFFLAGDEDAKHSLVKTAYHTKQTKVAVNSIDNLVNNKVSLIKTDTEGNDIAVLKGAKNLIMGNHNISIIVEFYPAESSPEILAVDLWFLMKNMRMDKCYFVNDYTGEVVYCSNVLDIVQQYNRIKLGVNLLFRRNTYDQ
jgi:FkbM family methyltransferase